jgi:hypothetical protein
MAVVKYKATLRLEDCLFGYIWFGKFKLGVIKTNFMTGNSYGIWFKQRQK